MFTDTVGYTASTQEDEGRALELLRQQAEVVGPLVALHQGKEVKSTGDGILVEFDSALKATQCAVSIQRRLYVRNAEKGTTPIRIRIGLHLGDVEQHGPDILGDAVNIAARIEPLAEPGGICISGAVYEQVRNKTPEAFEKLAPTVVKGLQLPLDVYRVMLPWTSRGAASHPGGPPRLAVLPLKNISPDPADEYIADGLHEELISVLSRVPGLRVISRTSASRFGGGSESVAKIGAELGVGSILEGSVRRAGTQLRITLQLIDVSTDEHRWTETYDRDLSNVFAVQAEVAGRVAEQLRLATATAIVSGLESRPAIRTESYLAYLKGQSLLYGVADLTLVASKQVLEGARQQFELAISLDPSNAAAHAALAKVVLKTGSFHAGGQLSRLMVAVKASALKAIEVDPSLAAGHGALAMVLHCERDWVGAEREYRQGLTLDPSDAESHMNYAIFLEDMGRGEEAAQELEQAVTSDPLLVETVGRLACLLLWLGRRDEAYQRIDRVRQLDSAGQFYHSLMSAYYLECADRPAALREHQEFSKAPMGPPWETLNRAFAHVLANEPEAARGLLRELDEMPLFPAAIGMIIEVYGELGDVDACFRVIERALRVDALPLQSLRMSPTLGKVRQDPRFQDVLRRQKLA